MEDRPAAPGSAARPGIMGDDATSSNSPGPKQPENPQSPNRPPTLIVISPALRRRCLLAGFMEAELDNVEHHFTPFQQNWWLATLPAALRLRRRRTHIVDVLEKGLARRAQAAAERMGDA